MIVVTVDENDIDRRTGERARRRKDPEPSAHDHHTVPPTIAGTKEASWDILSVCKTHIRSLGHSILQRKALLTASLCRHGGRHGNADGLSFSCIESIGRVTTD